jgi:hypothetical protein
MRPLVIGALIALATTCNLARGNRTLTRQVAAGQTVVMWRYGNVKKDCSPEGGVVKVRSKPKHGKLTQQQGLVPITYARFPEMAPCIGRVINGIVVSYTADPGFQGTDSFSIELLYQGHPTDVDTFTVNVQ